MISISLSLTNLFTGCLTVSSSTPQFFISTSGEEAHAYSVSAIRMEIKLASAYHIIVESGPDCKRAGKKTENPPPEGEGETGNPAKRKPENTAFLFPTSRHSLLTAGHFGESVITSWRKKHEKSEKLAVHS
jgi:hypothetical protein